VRNWKDILSVIDLKALIKAGRLSAARTLKGSGDSAFLAKRVPGP